MVSLTNSSAILACDAAVDAVDGGTTNPNGVLRIYDGTPPARVDEALSGNTVLAELPYSNPAYGNAVDVPASNLARATANAITDDTSANASGTATFARSFDRDDNPVLQHSVGTSGAELNLNSVGIVAGTRVEVTSLSVAMPEA